MFAVQKRLKEIVLSVLPLPDAPRVIDAGCGTGCLITYLHEIGVQDILGVDLSQGMLDALSEKFSTSGVLGNESGIRTWKGDFVELPSFMGPVDAIFFNSVFGNFYCQRTALLKAISLMEPQGQIVVSHPNGKEWLQKFRKANLDTVPHDLPSMDEWHVLTADLPLTVKQFRDEKDLYLTLLEVLPIPDCYAFEGSPIFVEGDVILGKGIGSAKLGVPTANLQPDSFQEPLKNQPKGVYFGWAKIVGTSEVHGAVFNLGICPTMKGDEGVSLEAHILHKFEEPFYGKRLKIALCGLLRPEIKFSGVEELLNQIQTDIGKAKNQLKKAELQAIKQHLFVS